MLWLLPLFAVGIASQVASAVVYLLAQHAGVTVDFQSQSILTVLVFGVGVDYALLLIARYREELRRHADRHTGPWPRRCAARSRDRRLGRHREPRPALPARRRPAGHPRPGPGRRGGRAGRHGGMTTLLPALVVLFGRWVFWPFVPRTRPGAERPPRLAGHRHRVGRSRGGWVVTAAALLALTGGIGSLSIGLPGDESFTKEVGSVTGQHLIEEHYPPGSASPAQILAAPDRPTA